MSECLPLALDDRVILERPRKHRFEMKQLLANSLLYLAECAKSSQCAPLKHHYDACAERVQRHQEDENYKGPKEDCVEECKWFPCSIPLPQLPPRAAIGAWALPLGYDRSITPPPTDTVCF